MKKQKQAYLHCPEEGVWGDCFRTSIAIALGMDRDIVPHFYDEGVSGDVATEQAKAWLSLFKIYLIEFPLSHPEGLEAILNSIGFNNPDLIYLLTGVSKNGTNHVVVCQGARIECDPSLDNSGIVGPTEDGNYWFTFFGKLLN